MKEFIEIPFSAKDSELEGWEYNIPEGYTASIENGKIIVKKEESEDEKIRKWLIEMVEEVRKANPTAEFSGDCSEAIAWLEKKCKQTSADKAESKFKVGDWIVKNDGKDCFSDGSYVLQITDFACNMYKLSNGCYLTEPFIDDTYRLWTIEDAKDGDVLYTSSSASNEIFIFKGLTIEGYVECYCSYDSEDKYCEGKYHFIGKPDFMMHPATKEQCDKLFQKIKEAGYEWDVEKKELKKIEQKPTWDEKDEKEFEQLLDILHANGYESFDIWLKSLKERYTWKPSEEQLNALDEVYKTHGANNVNRRIILNLLEQLRKL